VIIFLSNRLGSKEILSVPFDGAGVSGPASGFPGESGGGGADCATVSFDSDFAGLRRLGRGLAIGIVRLNNPWRFLPGLNEGFCRYRQNVSRNRFSRAEDNPYRDASSFAIRVITYSRHRRSSVLRVNLAERNTRRRAPLRTAGALKRGTVNHPLSAR
jgi:hypothetical protein